MSIKTRKKARKLFSLIAYAALLCMLGVNIPEEKAQAATAKMTLEELREKFPNGKYWNHADTPGATPKINNQDGYTSKPCPVHANLGTATQTCNAYAPFGMHLSWQCMGFAEKLGYDATGLDPRTEWSLNRSKSALDTLKAGDIVRYKNNGHSIYVIAVDGETVTYADCNSDGHCVIRWDATITKSKLRETFTNVRVAPFDMTGAVSEPGGEAEYSGFELYEVISTSGINIRKGPGTGYEKNGYVAYNEKVYISEKVDDGTYIWGRLSNDKGYIAMNYTTYISGSFDKSIPSTHVHKYVGEKVAPTCEEAGMTKHVCELGDAEYLEPDAESVPRGHSYNSGIIIKAPTASTTGKRLYTCVECKKTKEEEVGAAQTTLKKIDDRWYYICEGEVDTTANTLYTYGGKMYYIKNGEVQFGANTLVKYENEWYYVKAGAVDFSATTLCKLGSVWYYVNKGKVDFTATTLCKYGSVWYYVNKGKVDFTATTLCKYGNVWYYVNKGKVDFNATTLCKLGSVWYYVNKGKVDFTATTLCKYGSVWYYVNKGRVDFNAVTLCKYGSVWYYVNKGKVDFTATTICKYGGKSYYVNKGKVDFTAVTLCKYDSKWYYINKGVTTNATTLCKYGGTWYYVENGVVNFSYTGNVKYGNATWYVKNGVMKYKVS